MHVYIYDDFVNTKKYASLIADIETRITDLGLSGKIIRLGLMKNVSEAVGRELRQGAKTLIAVGNNKTVSKVLNAVISIDPSSFPAGIPPLGIIPVGNKHNTIAAALGVEPELTACDILSARRIETLDLGQANNLFFVSEASITNQGTTLEIDQSYSIEILETGDINVINLPTAEHLLPEGVKPSPQDNTLELCVTTAKAKKLLKLQSRGSCPSIFSFKHLTILNKTHPLIIDGSFELKAPIEIKLASRTLPVIVGKNRGF